MSEENRDFGFAPDEDAPIPYRQRIRDYYQALGCPTAYRWAHYAEVPFHPRDRPLARPRVTLVTTAAPYHPDKGDQGPGAAYNAAAKFYEVYSRDTARDHDLRIAHLAYDRAHTSAADPGTWLPLPALREAAAAGRVGALAPRFLFSDFPLGNAAGRPHDRPVAAALECGPAMEARLFECRPPRAGRAAPPP
ncbi:MAG TPA: hypothetical protein VJ770_01265 [Stellaceae bacterium]|nr:hypothetical protein [Stellaceae bacterium]